MVICGSCMFEFSVSEDMKKNVINFDKLDVNEQESGVPSLKLQAQCNPCFIGKEASVGKVAVHLCLTLIVGINK